MLPTQSSGAGAFSQFDLERVPSPCFVIDEVKLQHNLEILQTIADASGAKILAALKACSLWPVADRISAHLNGTCASGMWEAQLARKYYGGELAVYKPAFKASEINMIAQLADHVIFNSPQQVETFSAACRAHNADIGLRINPQYPQGLVEKYDPCAARSRLGYPVKEMDVETVEPLFRQHMVSGLHIHVLCEQDFPPLEKTYAHIEPLLQAYKDRLNWLNLGGGHLITKPDYQRQELIAFLKKIQADLGVQAYLEPGAAIVFDAGILVGEIIDVTDNEGAIAILDISPTCHMPDVLEAPYRPLLMGEAESGEIIRLAGASCLAGDVIGDYQFADLPQAGARLAFLDQAHYSMVKTTSFNGVELPAIALWNSQTDALEIIRQFDFTDFEMRLG